jgi:putative transposase
LDRRGNNYDNGKAESFMKTLKVEAAYPKAFETFTDVAESLPPAQQSIVSGFMQFEDQHTRQRGALLQ